MPRLKPKTKVAKAPPALIGWRERVKLPGLGIGTIVAKIDTGARSAALHAEDIVVAGRHVRFRVPINGRDHHCELPFAGVRRVKSSSGHGQTRAVVETDVQIGTHRYAIEVTLTDRADMGFAMLLGRASVRGHFVVHPGRSFIVSRTSHKAKPR
ncbi:MAG: ATP-dependent zinc protease [Rhizobiales bacterium]|nr:ATP-dependent zinc protease [Hyphomicrobiales bacterium]MBI3673731.1 ATP-dependent zinc protease [Hyphomicrobiales bacterium]